MNTLHSSQEGIWPLPHFALQSHGQTGMSTYIIARAEQSLS